ncbi:MAG: DUF5715 family protein [Patescibacteria group bacterium]
MKRVLAFVIIALLSLFSFLSAQTPSHASRQAGLLGSQESQDLQNEEAEKEGLTRIENDAILGRLKKEKILVKLPTHKNLKIDYRLPPQFRFCLPQVRTFLIKFASDPRGRGRIVVNSATRTDTYQRRLRKHNPNAIILSSHVFGCTVDIAKKGHTPAQLNAMREYLRALKIKGVIEPVEEFRQSVFHIMVFKSYVENKSPQ